MIRRPPYLSTRPPGDRGAATVWIVLMVPVVLLFIGFVLDAGAAVRDWNMAHDQAAAAARVGAQHIDLAAYRATGTVRLDPTAAATAARRYLRAAHLDATVTATTTTVTVTVTHHTPTQLLAVAGVDGFTEHATAIARPLYGVTGPL